MGWLLVQAFVPDHDYASAVCDQTEKTSGLSEGERVRRNPVETSRLRDLCRGKE
ncbi:hypothetical protein [Laceyella putida]|uniref:Uncharacterized protein n=1 Tax=Laceyella putida TaxID=110101 RepID=A0ABW2RHK5_9BACL